MNLFRLRADLTRQEAERLKPYCCKCGAALTTLGHPEGSTCPGGSITIGVGRNLSDTGINGAESDLMLDHDIREATMAARRLVPTFQALSEARQEVLVNMAFNLGESRLRGFKLMLAAIDVQRFDKAADEMLDSRWATQVGGRAIELAKRMREG